MAKKNTIIRSLLTVFLSLLTLVWIYPIFMILINSFKADKYISTNTVFTLPDAVSYTGFDNYITALLSQGFAGAFMNSLIITVTSVVLILLCTSMCAWYITRVNNLLSKLCYALFVFSMVVPFQMLMFTLSGTADQLNLNNPFNICIIYLGFGAGLAVFMFTGFIKSISIEIEEAAMIDGCNPLETFWLVIFPIMKPTTVTVAILESMWVWNDYLLPSLVLNINHYKTIPIAIQYLKQSHGQIDWGAMMAVLVLAIIPIVVFYVAAQKYIIEGVLAGAVKG